MIFPGKTAVLPGKIVFFSLDHNSVMYDFFKDFFLGGRKSGPDLLMRGGRRRDQVFALHGTGKYPVGAESRFPREGIFVPDRDGFFAFSGAGMALWRARVLFCS